MRRRPNKEALRFLDDPDRDPTIRLSSRLFYETCHFLATADDILHIDSGDQGTTSSLSDIIAQGIHLDARLAEWSSKLSGNFRYESVDALTNLALSGTCAPQTASAVHIYSSISMAYLWNLHRCARILLNDSLIYCLLRSEELNIANVVRDEQSDSRAELSEKISGLVDDICASVPYLLGEINQEGNLQRSPHNRAVGGYFLLYPLRVTLALNRASPAQNMWIVKQLEYIKNIFGIQGSVNNLPNRSGPHAPR